jgi:hypothetical protein
VLVLVLVLVLALDPRIEEKSAHVLVLVLVLVHGRRGTRDAGRGTRDAERGTRDDTNLLRNQRADLVELHLRVDRADVRVLVEWIAHANRLHAIAKFAHQHIENRFFHKQPRSSATHVTLVKEDAADDPFDGLIQRRIRKNDVCRFAA